ncbi:hypothetical protein ASPZODRAFT_140666 [Penicilliopsis zonata CBS 506.65]|uniref:MARVEL domain-containing protein n=1 Tax=Penicilliopsis zonata CBS 506.65 TaxID=1073090 RepID=A0A1L9SMF7_9EURO|nr:hypothetical protein ASPZODRAFT_140666 [Penicilliopsis zonata CBS 506.65]OJJ48368.1 hypothetical protein ASPZODRAFT_140666 [Penicilliopsis zonata CBS 506.65]
MDEESVTYTIHVSLESFLRLFEVAGGVAVIVLYGTQLSHHADDTAFYRGCVYAILTGIVATLASLLVSLTPFELISLSIYFRPIWYHNLRLLLLELGMLFLWIVLFVYFGIAYLWNPEFGIVSEYDPEYMAFITLMKRAAWLDLANVVLWSTTGVFALLRLILNEPYVVEEEEISLEDNMPVDPVVV